MIIPGKGEIIRKYRLNMGFPTMLADLQIIIFLMQSAAVAADFHC